MQVTRDVILDLLPIYCAGEVTADTRSLVDEYLRTDAELAARAAEIRRALRSVEISFPRGRSGDADLIALRKVRGAVRLRGTLLGISIFFTCLIGSVWGNSYGVHWAWSGFPQGAVISAVIAVAAWIGYFRLRRRLGV